MLHAMRRQQQRFHFRLESSYLDFRMKSLLYYDRTLRDVRIGQFISLRSSGKCIIFLLFELLLSVFVDRHTTGPQTIRAGVSLLARLGGSR